MELIELLRNQPSCKDNYHKNSDGRPQRVASEHVAPVVLVVRYPGQRAVPAQHEDHKLDRVAEETRALPCHALLKVQLYRKKLR